MKLAFVFPGQGMQEPGMSAMLMRGTPERTYLERAVGSDVSRALERGGPQLERTDVLQPTLVAASLAVASQLSHAGVHPHIVAGHSVGEIAALAVAGGISSEEAVDVAATRGRLMAREAGAHPGGMLALLQATEESAHAALALGSRLGTVDLAAVNAPDQWVLSGETRPLEAIAAQFSSYRLPVAGAWHSKLMAGALPELLRGFQGLAIRPLRASLLLNRDGRPAVDVSTLPEILAGQLVRPVYWARTLATLHDLEVTDIVTVGPGRVLRGLIRKSLGDRVRIHMTEGDLGRTIDGLKRLT